MDETRYCSQGDMYCSKGLHEMAIAQYTRAIEVNPQCGEAYTGRGLVYCLYIKDLYEEALSDFTKAIELNPDNAVAYHGRGLIYLMKGLHELAILDFTRVIEIHPKWGAGVYVSRGELHFRFGHLPEAVRDFTTALEFNAENGMAYRGRALAWYHQGEYVKALPDAQKARLLGVETDCNEIDPEFLASLITGKQMSKPVSASESASVIPFPALNARKSAGGV